MALTAVLRWSKKAGEDRMQALALCNQEDWQQLLCIDDKWVEVQGAWNYVFTAVGTIGTDLLAINLFHLKVGRPLKLSSAAEGTRT